MVGHGARKDKRLGEGSAPNNIPCDVARFANMNFVIILEISVPGTSNQNKVLLIMTGKFYKDFSKDVHLC